MQITNNLRKTLQRRLIRVSHQSLICSVVGIALLSESVIAIPNNREVQIAQQPVSTDPENRAAAKTAFKEYDIGALETTDRSRARSLVELLTESKADIRVGIEPKLLARERDLNGRRDALEQEKQKLASSKDSDAAISDLNQKIDKLIKEQEELRTEIRIASPSYAALKFPTPLTLPQIQQKVLDDNTLLLTYSLGADHSYLWLVSKTEIQSYELPKRSIIEAQAKQFYEQQKTAPTKAAKDRQIGAQLSSRSER
jgi:hypothetical protein